MGKMGGIGAYSYGVPQAAHDEETTGIRDPFDRTLRRVIPSDGVPENLEDLLPPERTRVVGALSLVEREVLYQEVARAFGKERRRVLQVCLMPGPPPVVRVMCTQPMDLERWLIAQRIMGYPSVGRLRGKVEASVFALDALLRKMQLDKNNRHASVMSLPFTEEG